MSSPPAPRKSIDSLASSIVGSERGQFSLSQVEGTRRPSAYHTRRSSTTSSIGGVLDISSNNRGNSVQELGQNAISTLLQPPIVRTGLVAHSSLPASGGYKAPTARDIPPVILSNIPHVEPSAFAPYLSQVGSLFEAFRRVKEENSEDDSASFRRTRVESRDGNSTKGLEDELRKVQRSESVASVESAIESRAPRRSSNGPSRRPVHAMTPLSTIPSVYFDQNFHLENPRTFDIVSERADVVRPAAGPTSGSQQGMNGSASEPATPSRKALATNAILQEKLSWYMDTVEMHLISSISTASSSFFAALGSLRELHAEAADSTRRIKDLRENLEKLDKDMAMGGLKVVRMRKRRQNLQKLGDSVDQLREIVNRIASCDEYLKASKLEEALDTVEGVERLISGEPVPSKTDSGKQLVLDAQVQRLDLRGIKALEGATQDLEDLRFRIGKGFEFRFLDVLLADIRRHVQNVPPEETLQRWASASQRSRGDHSRTPSVVPAYLTVVQDFRSILLSQLNGLNRSNALIPATSAYRENVLKQIKSLIRYHLPSSNEDDNESMMSASTQSSKALSQQEKSSILARNLRELTPIDAEEMLARTYAGIGEALRRLGVQVKVLLDITSGISPSSPTISIGSPMKSPNPSTIDDYLTAGVSNQRLSPEKMQQDLHQALDLSSLLGQSVDISQAQITKILKVRSDQSSRLPLQRFLRYFTLNRLFADECEAVSGRGGSALKTVVNGHIKEFVQRFQEEQRQKLLNTMDADHWDAKDFGPEEHVVLERILQGFTKDADVWTNGSRIWEAEQENTNLQVGVKASSTKDKARNASIDEDTYILPASAMAVLRGIDQFQHLITGIPSMTIEIGPNLLEYLRLFNSRSHQLILGAGATRSAGLKNITTKHLALASQALSFIIALIPYVREFIRRHAPSSSNLMTEFDKVKRTLQEHQVGIQDKLVEIMSGRATAHVAAMKKVDWEVPRSEVNDYMEKLTKETSTLHRVLSKHLPELTVSMIMNPVFSSYREQWGKAFQGVEIKSEAGKDRLVSDLEHFNTRISKLDGAGDVGDYLLRIVKGKPVVTKVAPAVPPTESQPSVESKEPPLGSTDKSEEVANPPAPP